MVDEPSPAQGTLFSARSADGCLADVQPMELRSLFAILEVDDLIHKIFCVPSVISKQLLFYYSRPPLTTILFF